MTNTTFYDSPQLDLFSLKRRILEQNIAQVLEEKAGHFATEALIQEFGESFASDLIHRYPFLYHNIVKSLQNQVPWSTHNIIPLPNETSPISSKTLLSDCSEYVSLISSID